MGGNRISTEEIESAILADTQRHGCPLRNAVVVGMPDEVLGTAVGGPSSTIFWKRRCIEQSRPESTETFRC